MPELLLHYAQFIDKINKLIGRGCALLLYVMVAVIFGIVFSVTVFSVGSVWVQELVTFLHGITFMGALGYTFAYNGHVRLDLLYNNFSRRTRCWINVGGFFLLAVPLFGSIIGYSLGYVFSSWEILEASSEHDGLPGVFLLKTMILLGPLLILLQGSASVARSFLYLIYAVDIPEFSSTKVEQ